MNKLIEKIQNLLEEKGLVLVGVDGLGGAGKKCGRVKQWAKMRQN